MMIHMNIALLLYLQGKEEQIISDSRSSDLKTISRFGYLQEEEEEEELVLVLACQTVWWTFLLRGCYPLLDADTLSNFKTNHNIFQ